MGSTRNSGVDIDYLLSQAEGQIDRQLLTGHGKGRLFSTGYLSDGPFYELLSVNEVPHYLFASTKKAPRIDGVPRQGSLGDYRAITAVTSDRLLYAVGVDDGDVTGAIEYAKIEAVDVADEGSLLRSATALRVETADHEHRFYGTDDVNPGELLDYVHKQIASVYEAKTRSHVADAEETLSDGDLSHADNQLDAARELSRVAEDWRERVEPDAAHDADFNPDAEIESVAERLSASNTAQTVLEDIRAAIDDGDVAFQSGNINAASADYDKARDCLDNLDAGVDADLDDIPEKHDLRYARAELRSRNPATTPTAAHRRLCDLLETARDEEMAAEETSNPKQGVTHLEAAVEAAKEYVTELQSADIGFDRGTPGGQCDGCGRSIGVALEVEIDETPVSVCAPCAAFGNCGQLIESMAEEYVEELEAECETTGPLPAAVRRIYNRHNWTPTRDEVLGEVDVYTATLQGRYGSYDDLLDVLDIDLTSDLLSDLQSVADAVDGQPTETDGRTHGRYELARFFARFGDWESALQAADLDATQDTDESTRDADDDSGNRDEDAGRDTPTTEELLAPVREAANELGRPPTYQEGMERTEFSGSQYGSQLGRWNEVLTAADLDLRGALSADLQSVADEIGMTPTRRNLDKHATYPPRLYKDHFRSIEAAINAAGFESVESDRYGWIRNIREFCAEQEEVPLPFDVRDHSPMLLDEIYDDVSTWDVALSEAGIQTGERDEFAERLLTELERVGEELGHQPSRREFDRYGSLPVTELESHFDSFEQALAAADLELPSGRPARGPLDEPPDASGYIPSHTDLLRELHWLVERKGRADSRERFEEIGSFDVEHYDLQFGSLDDAFDRLRKIQPSDTRGTEYVPRRALIDELSQFGGFLERAPTLLELLYYGSTSLKKFAEKFESLADIHNAAGFEYTEDLPATDVLLDDIRRLGDELGRPPVLDEYAERGGFDYTAAIRRFDGWVATLNAADYDLLSTVPTLQYYRTKEVDRVRFESTIRLQTGFGIKPVLLDDLYRLQHQFGDRLSAALVTEYGRYPLTAYHSAFGGVDAAISTIGATPTDTAIDTQKLDQSLRAAFVDIETRLGRQPTREEVDALGEYVVITYVARFSSWEATLDTCPETPNFDDHEAATPYALLWELDRVAGNTRHTARPGVLLAKGQYDTSAYLDAFDSWQDLYEAAGHEWECSEPANIGPHTLEFDTDQNKSGPNDADSTGDKKSSPTVGTSGNEAAAGTEDQPDDKAYASDGLADNADDTEKRQAMIDTLQDLYDDLDRIPLAHDIQDRTEYFQYDYTSEFGSWDNALAEAGYDKRDALLKELERVADDLGRIPSTADMNEHGQYSASMFTKFFGSWTNALDKLDREEVTFEQENDDSTDGSATTEKKALIDELKRLSNEIDGLVKATDMRERGAYAVNKYTGTFGSWDEALNRAGIDRETQLLNEIERVWEQLGRRPSAVEMNEHGRVSATTITKYFDSWKTACQQASPNTDSLAKFNFDNNSHQNEFRADLPGHKLDEEELDRLRDIIRLQPTKNAELMDQWGLESGGEVHQYLESHITEYYYRGDNSYMWATDEAESLIQKVEDNALVDGESVSGTDSRQRDLIISLVGLTQRVGHLPDADEIKEQGEYTHQQYQEEFGNLFHAYQVAGLLPEDAIRDDFHKREDFGSEPKYQEDSKDESGEDKDARGNSTTHVGSADDDSSENAVDDALKKKMLFDEGP
jgi:hypothetical protein